MRSAHLVAITFAFAGCSTPRVVADPRPSLEPASRVDAAPRGTVLVALADEVVVSLGESAGLYRGKHLIAFRRGQPLGRLTVASLWEDGCRARIDDLLLALTKGDEVVVEDPDRGVVFSEPLIDVNFVETPLAVAMAEIGERVGKTIVVDPPVQDYERVTVSFKKIPWNDAVSVIAKMAPHCVERRGRVIVLHYVCCGEVHDEPWWTAKR